METRVCLEIVVPEDTIFGEYSVYVGKWEGPVLLSHAIPHKGTVVLAPLENGKSTVPYTIAALREAADDAISKLLDKMAEGIEIPLVMVPTQQT